MRLVRVLVVDDSPIFREVMREVLEADGRLCVAGEAADGKQAVRLAQELAPDLVTLDIQMPGMDGLAAIEEIMSLRPTPILVLTAQPTGPGSALAFQATRRGALDVCEKREVGRGWRGGTELCDRLVQLAAVPVVRHLRALAPADPAAPALPGGARPGLAAGRARVIGIGASAGGPPAVAAVLGALPAALPACVAVVQHFPVGFAESFAHFLAGCTGLRVVTVAGPTAAEPGTVLLAADDRHLVASGPGTFDAVAGPPSRGHRPSVDVLFSSLARHYGREAAAALLTGMGDDGARGLAQLKEAGALTLVQDEQTSAVWGMPRAAAEAGAAERVLPLSQIGPALAAAAGGG